ncbi:MAG: DUF393 domain-containing protein [Flavobacteriales bacterium]|nr:DUF393 domain-containing protein [Flavobacteriales bacterium]
MIERRSILFIDGYCNLCSGAVQFILPRDQHGRFHLAPLSGTTADELLKEHPLENQPDSLLLWEEGAWHTKSTAALRVARKLRGWKWAWSLRYIPRFIRDGMYDLVARSRFTLWGKRDSCYLPRPEWTSRFLP